MPDPSALLFAYFYGVQRNRVQIHQTTRSRTLQPFGILNNPTDKALQATRSHTLQLNVFCIIPHPAHLQATRSRMLQPDGEKGGRTCGSLQATRSRTLQLWQVNALCILSAFKPHARARCNGRRNGCAALWRAFKPHARARCNGKNAQHVTPCTDYYVHT